MKKRVHRILVYLSVVLLVLSVSVASVIWIYSAVVGLRQREAENILFYYREKIILQMRGTVNEATALAQTAHAMKSLEPDAAAWFEAAAAPLMERPEVRMVGLFEGDVLTAMLPRSKYEKLTGQELRNFSYIYTMSKVVKELVVEGPVVLQNDPEGQEVFLFLQPIIEEAAKREQGNCSRFPYGRRFFPCAENGVQPAHSVDAQHSAHGRMAQR